MNLANYYKNTLIFIGLGKNRKIKNEMLIDI